MIDEEEPNFKCELCGCRACKLCFDLLTIGMVNDMFIENRNDEVADKVYAVQATQADFDLF